MHTVTDPVPHCPLTSHALSNGPRQRARQRLRPPLRSHTALLTDQTAPAPEREVNSLSHVTAYTIEKTAHATVNLRSQVHHTRGRATACGRPRSPAAARAAPRARRACWLRSCPRRRPRGGRCPGRSSRRSGAARAPACRRTVSSRRRHRGRRAAGRRCLVRVRVRARARVRVRVRVSSRRRHRGRRAAARRCLRCVGGSARASGAYPPTRPPAAPG